MLLHRRRQVCKCRPIRTARKEYSELGPNTERTIVVATDGSDGADLAVSHAIVVARALRAGVTLAAVYAGEEQDRSRGTLVSREEARALIGDAISRHGPAADPESDPDRQSEGDPGPSLGAPVPLRGTVAGGPVTHTLIDLAREEEADLLVVGNRRWSARPAGSLPAALAADAPCDVLVVDTANRRRPGFGSIAVVDDEPPPGVAQELARAFGATLQTVSGRTLGRRRHESSPVGGGADLSKSNPYDLLVLGGRPAGHSSRSAIARLIETAGTSVLVVRPKGPEAGVRRARRGKELRMARGGPEALVDVPLFASLSKRHLRHVAALTEEEQFAEGATLAQEGKPGDTFYVLLEGEAKVVRGGRRMDRLIPGDFFGEIALIDGGPRTASVIATTPITTLTINRKRFRKMLDEDPSIVLMMLEELAKRLRNNERSPTG